jgi:hypothetical protein
MVAVVAVVARQPMVRTRVQVVKALRELSLSQQHFE